MNDLYSDLHSSLLAKGDTNFCVPVALSIVSGVHVDEVNRSLMAKPSTFKVRTPRRRRRCGVYEADWRQEALDMGLTLTDVTSHVGASTVTSAARRLDPAKKYLIKVRRHLIAFAEGKIQDWTEGRRHRIISILEVTGQNDLPPRTAPVVTFEPAAPAPVAPAPAKAALLRIITDHVGDSHWTVKMSGRWVSVKFLGGRAVKVTEAKGSFRVCVSKGDEKMASAAARFTLLSERAKDVTFNAPNLQEILNFLKTC